MMFHMPCFVGIYHCNNNITFYMNGIYNYIIGKYSILNQIWLCIVYVLKILFYSLLNVCIFFVCKWLNIHPFRCLPYTLNNYYYVFTFYVVCPSVDMLLLFFFVLREGNICSFSNLKISVFSL